MNEQPLSFIINNIEAAQKATGTLTMEDCRFLLKSLEILTNLLNKNVIIGDKEVEAYNILVDVCKKLQSRGIFSIKGSVAILNYLEDIEHYIINNKNTSTITPTTTK